MIYLTVNDAPGGVYKSQVIDVLKQINQNTSSPVQLIAFISVRGFKKNKKTIKSWYKHAVVVPMIPGIARWHTNRILLKLRFPHLKNQTCIARNVMAYAIAESHFKTRVYDGRGAIGAELQEYPDMIPNTEIVKDIINWEKKAVLEADFRIAVSNQLVNHWKQSFGYDGDKHVVIPCTVSQTDNSENKRTAEILKELGWQQTDTILIYSGGIAGWQSFDKLTSIIPGWISKQGVKVLFLTKNCPEIDHLTKTYPKDVKRLWLKPEEVHHYTSIGDYGILIREENITNAVASPVKFAEYLNAGLKVLISNHIGDFSEFVKTNNCGHLLEDLIAKDISFSKTSPEVKKLIIELAVKHFSKAAHNNSYRHLTEIK